jgi:membrane associated rhomboid family serine protease
MIPLRDSIPSRTTPIVSYAIITLCSLVFLAQLTSEDGGSSMIQRYGFVPARLSHPEAELVLQQRVKLQTPRGVEEQIVEQALPPAAIPAWLTLISCIFLHGGWMHFLGNVWFLSVFGDNVEDRIGHLGFASLYLATGVAAGLAHYATDSESVVPTIGASGAIAGVMGAYAWFYPNARVEAILPLFVIIQVVVLPASLFLGIWFAIQALSGITASASGRVAGVAWWAHIGGFVAGGLVALILRRTHHCREAVTERRF